MNPIAIIAIIAAVFFAFVAVGLACCLAKTYEQRKKNTLLKMRDNRHEFIDLGLPSGTLWAAENATLDGAKHFAYKQAVFTFRFDMPTLEDFQELCDNCGWKWDNKRKGYTVTGPNGASIFLPASGYRNGSDLNHVGSLGYYWAHKPYGFENARLLAFCSGHVDPLCAGNVYIGCSVRLVRRTASVNVR